MIAKILRRLMQIERNMPIKRISARWSLSKIMKQVLKNPGDSLLHKKLGDEYVKQNRWIEAIAEYRTALSLGAANPVYLSLANAYLAFGQLEFARLALEQIQPDGNDKVRRQAGALQSMLKERISQPLSKFNHNRYYRLKTIADHITDLYGNSAVSILDIGGGDGALSLFLPACRYVLAEPAVNGLSVNDFSEKSFDVVVACHVLEHIPTEERGRFLDALALRTRHYVLLLNPFFQQEGHWIITLL
jgi:tetratricopeptide (TPR) repeat protein